MSSTINEVYQLGNNDQAVTLEVTVGFAQPAESTVTLNGNRVNGTFSNTFSTELGTNNELNTKELVVTTIVQAINQGNTSITIKLSGGVGPQEWTMTQNVDEGSSATYRATIGLFS